MKTLDYLVIAIFFAVMVGVGVYYSRRQKSSGQYFGSDRSTPWWLAGVSIYMNSFSALAFVMYSTLAYKYGMLAATMCWASVPAMLLGLWFVALKMRRSAQTSPLDFIRSRYGNKMNQALVWLGIPMQLLDGAFKLLAIGTVVGMVLQTTFEGASLDKVLFWAIVLSGAVIIAYTFLGGLKAAVVCDLIQFFVIVAVVVVLPYYCIDRLVTVSGSESHMQGLRFFIEKAKELDFFKLARADVEGGYGWTYMFFTFVLVGLNLATSWSLIQRYAATKSEKDAKKAGYLLAGLQTISPLLFYFPAMAARFFLDLDLNDPDQMNGVYALVCLAVLPCGMVGMMISAMFSATMSSLAGIYNAIANVFTTDVYKNIINKNASDRSLVIVGRLATIALGVIVMALTFYMRANQGKNDLVDMCNRMFSVFLPPISVSMLIGIFSRKATKRAGLTALVTGIVVGTVVFFFAQLNPEYRYLTKVAYMTTITFIATITGATVGTLLFKDSPEEKAEVAAFFKRLDTPVVE
jgi:SSS family transporter